MTRALYLLSLLPPDLSQALLGSDSDDLVLIRSVCVQSLFFSLLYSRDGFRVKDVLCDIPLSRQSRRERNRPDCCRVVVLLSLFLSLFLPWQTSHHRQRSAFCLRTDKPVPVLVPCPDDTRREKGLVELFRYTVQLLPLIFRLFYFWIENRRHSLSAV